MDTVRTRGQLNSLTKVKRSAEELDEALLDEDSEGETKMSKMETDQEADKSGGNTEELNDVFEDTPPDMPGSKMPDLDIGGAHSTVKAARRAASSRQQLNPVPTSLEHARFSTSFTSGGDERILRCTISHNLKDRTTTPLSFDPRKHTCSSCVAGVQCA